MTSFNLEDFTRRLLTEALFYDEEYGALGNLSLIDPEAGQERYVASYLPEDGSFVIPGVPAGKHDVWVWNNGEVKKWKSVEVARTGTSDVVVPADGQ